MGITLVPNQEYISQVLTKKVVTKHVFTINIELEKPVVFCVDAQVTVIAMYFVQIMSSLLGCIRRRKAIEISI